MTEPTEIFNSIRYRWRKEDADAVREAFRSLHRTEQQNIIANLVNLLDEAGNLYGEERVDARNEASPKWCFDLPKAPHFPFI